jgi:hypothetical protein
MNRLTFVLLFVLLGPACVPAQVTSNVLERVLNVRVNAGTSKEETATAFTVDVDGREYLITAKHVVAGLKEQDKLDIFMNDKWKSLDVQIFRCDEPIDIAVVIPPYQLTVNFSLPTDIKFIYGQDAYFLGFPYGMQTAAAGINGPYPLAIIKHGIISGTQIIDRDKKATLMFLDGYNNPGFSGGPIVYKDLNENGLVLKLAGVVSGFRPEVVPVMKEHDIASPLQAGETAKSQSWRIQKRVNGTFFEYVDTSQIVALNTGIVVGFEFQPAVDLIHQHPIGPEAKDLPNNTPTPDR